MLLRSESPSERADEALPELSGRDCVRLLYRLRFRLTRLCVGSEVEAVRLQRGDRIALVPLHAPLARGELMALLRDAGISPREFAEVAWRRFPERRPMRARPAGDDEELGAADHRGE